MHGTYIKEGLGLSFDEAVAKGSDILSKAGPALQAAGKVIEDPFLPEVTCQVLRLNRLSRGEPPGPRCVRTTVTPTQAKRGIGLSVATRPLRAFVWAREHPALAVLAGVGIASVVFGAGYAFGRRRGA